MNLPRSIALFVIAIVVLLHSPHCSADDGADFVKTAGPLLKTYCIDCHGKDLAEAEINLEILLADKSSFATNFKTWRTAARMLDENLMPPAEATLPGANDRKSLSQAIRNELLRTAKLHAADPGEINLRRLTSAEYDYTIQDLTGVDLKLPVHLPGDAVGGEGFSNVGLVQFVQDSTLEQYLKAAKRVASHAVVGAGPLRFAEAPGKTGQELSAIARIQAIYREHGFRTAAGEGGEAFGLDRYPKAFFAAWRYEHRETLGRKNANWKTLGDAEGIDARFARHIWKTVTRKSPSFPLSEIASRWRELPEPDRQGKYDEAKIRAGCLAVHQLMLDWQGRFGMNPDAKEEAPLLAADLFDVSLVQPFEMNINWPEGTKTAHLQVFVQLANRKGKVNAVVVWKNPRIQFRKGDGTRTKFRPLKEFLTKETIGLLKFGNSPVGGKIAATDFVTVGSGSPVISLPIPPDVRLAVLEVDAELDVEHGEDCIVRCSIAQSEDTDQGKSVSGILANPNHPEHRQWKAGVLEFARMLPQVSNREPAPSDRDPIPQVFDGSYNNPERNHFHYKIKYHRDDRFLVENILDDATRRELDQAWIDLLGSFEYHDAYLRFIAKKAGADLNGQTIDTLDPAWIKRLPQASRNAVLELQENHQTAKTALDKARPGHLEDAIRLAERAWRRPLEDSERNSLRTYYEHLTKDNGLDHPSAIRTLLARIFVAPAYLYRVEQPQSAGGSVALSQWELASRLSYFLWSSLPDEELNRAAAAGELDDPRQLAKQARRMLKDLKAKRFAAEFFGQWFGFYRFQDYQGIDAGRFPEFTESFRGDLETEATEFFAYLVRENRPVGEILFADYAFLNQRLAKHYGMNQLVEKTDSFKLVRGTKPFERGGLLGLGAVHAVTSAPLRTSPVKRGDWVLRRVLGTPVPPPPADAGSIPADDSLGDGKTIKERLAVHRREASCNNCHSRIDPLGFALEAFDPIGRRREKYRDGQRIDASGVLRDGTSVSGTAGLKAYLKKHEDQFQRTLCTKLVGYAFGRAESLADQQLIEDMLQGLKEDDGFASLIVKIVTSPQFRFQRGLNFETRTAKEAAE